MVDAIPFAMPPSLGFSIGVKVAEVLTCLAIQPCVCGLPARAPVYVFACFEPRSPPPFPLSLFTLYCWMPLSLSGPLHHSQNQTSRNEPCFSLFPLLPSGYQPLPAPEPRHP